MTDHPHAKLLEEVRSALSTAEWHISARMIELRDARQPAGETAAALNKVRDAIRDLKGAIAALETAPPTPPSASLVEAEVLAMVRKVLGRPGRHLSSDQWLERYEAALIDICDRLTAHPAAEPGIDDRPVTDKERARTQELAVEHGWSELAHPAADAPPSPGVEAGIKWRYISDELSPRMVEIMTGEPYNSDDSLLHGELNRRWKQLVDAAPYSTVQPTTGGGGDREAIGLALYTAKYSDGSDPGDDAIIALRPSVVALSPSPDTDEAAFEAAYAGANDEACITYPGENEGPLREAFRLGAALTAARRARPTPDEMAAEVARLRAAITWALGEGDSDFGNNLPPARPRRAHYWWRAELSERAFGQREAAGTAPRALD